MEHNHKRMQITVYGDEGEDIIVPACYEVCNRCNGTGKHTNPSIDGHGITREEMDELGPEFEEDYFSGAYDVPCHECNGRRVVLVPDEQRATEEQMEAFYSTVRALNETDKIQEMEMRSEQWAERMLGF